MSTPPYRILCCDGGGIRGLITALLLQDLEKRLDFLQHVNLFAGTSTGGLIAIGLAGDIPISELVELYSKKGGEIFTPYEPELKKEEAAEIETDFEKRMLSELWHVKYESTGLKNVLEELLPADKELKDLSKKVMVTTFQLDHENSWRPITLDNFAGSPTAGVKAVDAGLSTGAAPVYFPPHKIDGMGYCIDGGVFANNPSTVAVAKALRIAIEIENIRMLSIGTGFDNSRIPTKEIDESGPLNYGIAMWLSPWEVKGAPKFPLLAALFDSGSKSSTLETEYILGGNYRRANVELEGSFPLDDYKNVKKLEKLTQKYMRTNEWKDTVTWVEENFI